MSRPMGTPVLRVNGISKTFGNRTVLRDFALDLQPGEVHGLLGENGSGKSTLIKILAGFHAPDPGGEMMVRGQEVRLPLNVPDPPKLGIGFVHQDLPFFESGSVLENVRIGRFETGPGHRIRWRREHRVVAAALREFGLSMDPATPVSRLSAIERAMLAVVRALDQLGGSEQAVLVLDEPTASLPNDGVERLFGAIRDVAARGLGVIFVTHRLEEVNAITDRVTVLRDGVRVLTAETRGLTQDDLIHAILGFSLTDLYPEQQHPPSGVPMLQASGVSGSLVDDVSVQVGQGEVVGVTGLVGMGFDELPYLLFGALPAQAGRMTLDGRQIDLTRLSPRDAVDSGVAMVPANRARDGAVSEASLAENMTLLTHASHYRGGRLRHAEERRGAARLLDEFDVRPRDLRQRFGLFSGGNQQKALLAKWLSIRPRVLLLHEPTQGVDIGAKRDVFAKIRQAADDGAAVMIASAEYEDLAQLCDRVLVVRHGRIVSELSGPTLTHQRVLDHVLRGDVSLAPPASV